MNDSPCRRRIRNAAILALLLPLSAALPCAAELLLLPEPPQAAAVAPKAGSPVRITVYGLNQSPDPVPCRLPETVDCRLSAAAAPVAARLVPGQPLPETVQPGMFVRAEYEFTPPAALAAAPARVESVSAAAGAGTPAGTPVSGSRLTPGRLDVFRNFSPYEANYFIAGPEVPTTRFQLSFKFRLLGDGAGSDLTDWTGRPHVAYTQVSLWDWSAPSAPFYDTSYKPEFFLSKENVPLKLPGVASWDFQYGVQHESNGKGEDRSRSLNIAYIKPVLHFGNPDKLHLTLAPRLFQYIGDMSDNPDMDEYRGYGDLTVKAGWDDGLMAGLMLRAGREFDHGCAQLELSYPLHRLPLCHSFSDNLYLFVQGFSGYGECLLDYDKRSTGVRFGIALSR